MLSLSLLVICFFSESFAYQTKNTNGDQKHIIPAQKPDLKVLLEALNTTENFWLKKLNYPKEYVTCLCFKQIRLTNDSYEFDEWYLKKEQRKKIPCSATFSEGPDGPVMNVKLNGAKGERRIPYVLRFWDKKETCGIFTLPSGCEQYVWDSHAKKTVRACDKAYKRFCGKKRYLMYKRTCKL
ncbi:uncharacterized protein LOC119180838 isoform X1 [Rhipicephalus microplus]|uniref:uncharacterized protein LOC119180838 isoform X1 n=1 Tax=Rhipicephalus microplus TaxID=6941 RepID=UPI001886E6A3|nr:uncharacterized protein LOC119180838 [Rhipicephalus microplus]